MKILCLSDLHQRMTDISDVIHQKRFTPFLQSIWELVEDTRPDSALCLNESQMILNMKMNSALFSIK